MKKKKEVPAINLDKAFNEMEHLNDKLVQITRNYRSAARVPQSDNTATLPKTAGSTLAAISHRIQEIRHYRTQMQHELVMLREIEVSIKTYAITKEKLQELHEAGVREGITGLCTVVNNVTKRYFDTAASMSDYGLSFRSARKFGKNLSEIRGLNVLEVIEVLKDAYAHLLTTIDKDIEVLNEAYALMSTTVYPYI